MLADLVPTYTEKLTRLRQLPPRGGHGLLRNWPANVVTLINGEPLTTEDILCAKRERQAAHLYHIRHPVVARSIPCFVWVFYNEYWIYNGWHLYVRTVRQSWNLTMQQDRSLIREIMTLFPCGRLIMPEFFRDWKVAFATTYPRSTPKRSGRQGLTRARALVKGGVLLAVTP